jgi:hypothetical protein
MPLSTPSNLEYLGPKPNFTRDTYDTLEAMQEALDSGHIDEGHQTYCTETGITYRAVKGTTGLVWEDTVGNLQRDLTQKILDNEKVASEALWDLNSRLSKVESEIIDDESEGMGPETRLDQVYNWFDAQTHIPVLTSQITKSSEGNLRQGTTHIYNAEFTWDWANREPGVTGVSITVNGSTTTKTFAEINKDPNVSGGTYTWSIPVSLGDSNITLGASFYNTRVQGTSSLTVQPLTPSYTWSVTGLPGSWESYNLSKTYTLSMTVTGKNLAASQDGDKIYKSDGTILKTITGVTDSDVTATETKTISLTSVGQLIWSWKSSDGNTTRGNKTYSPRPSFFIVSSTTGDTVSGAVSHALGISKQAYLSSGPTETPVIEFPANCTGIYISPYDVRSLKVKSQKSGETTWTTNSSWTYKGTYTYNGVTYYYIGNQGIGAGNFKFKFET